MAFIGNRFELLIVDEAHNINGATTLDTFAMSTAPMRLGLTATPPRAPDAAARLRAALGPTVYRLEIRQLAGSDLAPFDVISLPVRLTAKEAKRYALERRVFRDFFIPSKRSSPNSTVFASTDVQASAMTMWIRNWCLLLSSLPPYPGPTLETALIRLIHRRSESLLR